MTRILASDGSDWLRNLKDETDMPQFQHRSGPPSRPRNSDNTRWSSEIDPAFDMPTWAWWLVPVFLIGLWVVS